MNNILNYKIKPINYQNPQTVFDLIDRGFMPSILTGNGPEDISKDSVIGINPVKNVTITKLDGIWNRLRALNNSVNFHEQEYPINRVGAVGYISYEALHSIENIKKQTTDLIEFPLANWTIYKNYYYFRNDLKKAWYITLEYQREDKLTGSNYKDDGFTVSSLKPDFTQAEYKNNVESIKDKIIEGEVYEVNLTQGLFGNFDGSPYSLFKKLYKDNSAPYSAYLEREDYSIVSNSPELFLKADKRHVETRPIKGTSPRGDNQKLDLKLKTELFNSYKDQAELYMITDLMRNDISKVCRVGSVTVLEKKRVEEYKNVFHLVSIINGELEEEYDYIDLLKATFPGGSITGCPKVRCMEITEELEKSSRNLYTGTIFLMNQEILNCNIVIRSAVVKDNKIQLNSGGAITIDSDPEDEYNETLIKLKSLFLAVNYENYL